MQNRPKQYYNIKMPARAKAVLFFAASFLCMGTLLLMFFGKEANPVFKYIIIGMLYAGMGLFFLSVVLIGYYVIKKK